MVFVFGHFELVFFCCCCCSFYALQTGFGEVPPNVFPDIEFYVEYIARQQQLDTLNLLCGLRCQQNGPHDVVRCLVPIGVALCVNTRWRVIFYSPGENSPSTIVIDQYP